MSQTVTMTATVRPRLSAQFRSVPGLQECLERLQIRSGHPETLPFGCGDVTAGSESELQTVVIGDHQTADLPRAVSESGFFANASRRAATGDTPRRTLLALQSWLHDNAAGVWENSWVRFPRRLLSPEADALLATDLAADRRRPAEGPRCDVDRFLFSERGDAMVRVPVSYLLKLALADALHSGPHLDPALRHTGERLLGHFLSDNTSPETLSFHVTCLSPSRGNGRELARETAKRFLLTHALTLYANEALGLRASGQRTVVFFSPHPPVRQKALSECISDAFYRELFMNPCLSGWDCGEAKHQYMRLCHQVLSRSHLNAVAKLHECGIIARDLVVLPSTSNISLANNGTHISLGSRRLTGLRQAGNAVLSAAHEKVVSDLAIKIMEHFLPLFVGTYSADPYRIDFHDFHPEKVLGFLSHELDYSHLRMLWWRWRRKASTHVLGHAMTPWGPRRTDRWLGRILRLRGDWVPDYRLIDYLAALLSTHRSPALDGTLGNSARLKQDLEDLGVFDARMSLYLPMKAREFESMGFCGFEGRYYSLFPGFLEDMAPAADLQMLITTLAFKYMAEGTVTGPDIPDDPVVESERRQAFFAAAIGTTHIYIHRQTPNQFMRRILAKVPDVRSSHRYAKYWKVRLSDYRAALLAVIEEDAADLIEMLSLRETMADLRDRLAPGPDSRGATQRLNRAITSAAGVRSPLTLAAAEFNREAERHYRDTLRREHLGQALDLLVEDFRGRHDRSLAQRPELRASLAALVGDRSPAEFVHSRRHDLLADAASVETLRTLIHLLLASELMDAEEARLQQLGGT
jgi:hypothetical protein